MKDINECIGVIRRAESTFFTTPIITSGFGQMPQSEQSKNLTASTLPGLGQFEWVITPLGWPASFQKLVELTRQGLVNKKFVIAPRSGYIDGC